MPVGKQFTKTVRKTVGRVLIIVRSEIPQMMSEVRSTEMNVICRWISSVDGICESPKYK
jgi:hypothetical protein